MTGSRGALPPPASVVLAAAAGATAGSLVVASLAFADVLPDWCLLFFYALPSSFLGAWLARELVPAQWRRVAAPLRRAWRLSPLGIAPEPPAPAFPPRAPRARRPRGWGAANAVAATWLALIGAVLGVLRSRRGRRVGAAVVGAGAAALVALVVDDLVAGGWPVRGLGAAAAAATAALFSATFALRAVAWQRLFRPAERPRSLVLAVANGAASVASLALPSRVDDALTIGIVRRLSRRPRAIGTIALTLFALGLIDLASLVPFAAYAAASASGGADRVAMAALVGVGVGAAAVAAALPRVRRSRRLASTGLGRWIAGHAPVSRRETAWSWLLVACSWLTQCAGLLLLLHGLGVRGSFADATAYVAAGAAASTLPIGPAGAATEAGAGAAVLAGAGASAQQAIALAITAQALLTTAGATIAATGAIVAWRGRARARRT
jgi:hypothetical protein